MAQAAHLNRRLLLAILRAPTSQTGLFYQKTQTSHSLRCISTSIPRLNALLSVSFGEETDRRIRTLGKSPATKPLAKPKRKRIKKQEVDIAPGVDALQTVSSSDENPLPKYPFTDSSENYDEPVFIEIEETSPSAAPPATKQQTTKPRKRKDKKEITDKTQTEETATVASAVPPTNKPIRKLEPWQVQKQALKQKLGGEAWNPRKKISPDAMDGIRSLHEGDPERFSTEKLAEHFKVSAEAIRRILKSKWRPSPELMDERRERWAKRHDRIWDHKAEIGQRPRRTKDRKPEGPEKFEEEIVAKQMLGQI